MATPEEYAGWIKANADKRGTPEFEKVAQAYQAAKGAAAPVATDAGADPLSAENINPAKDMSGPGKFAAGVGKAIVDTGRGVGQLVGATTREDVAAARKRDEALMDTGAGMAGDVAGNIGMMLLPGGAVKAAGTAAKIAGSPGAAAALSAAGNTLLMPKTLGAAVPIGAGMGFIQPSASTGETVTNTGVGAVANAALPALATAFRAAKAAAEPLYASGKDAILGRLLNRVAGDEAPAAAANLRAAGALFVGPPAAGQPVRTIVGEIVPGSVPTTGQAAQNAGIASLERTATDTEPAATVAMARRMADQNAARIAEVERVAGDPGKRAFFDADRKTVAEQMYETAYQKGVDLKRDAATGQMLSKADIAARKGEITKLMRNPYIAEAVPEAKKLMAGEFQKINDPAGSVKGLDYLQRALKDKIEKASGNEQRILVGVRNRLLTTIDTLSPDYKAAREMFTTMSKPINQMDVGQELLNRGVNKTTGTLEPTKFINNLTDATAAKATGFKKATLEGTLEPEQHGALTAVAEDLRRAVAARNAGGSAGSDTVKKLAYSNFIDASGVPTWMRGGMGQFTGNVAARAADALYGRANREMATKLAEIGLNPAEAGRVMTLAARPGNERLLEKITGGGSAVARTAALSLINAQQQ